MAKLDDVLIDPFSKLYEEEITVAPAEEAKPEKEKKKKLPIKAAEPILLDPSFTPTEKHLIEAALFTSTKPLKVNEISRIVSVSSLGLVKKLVDELKQDYSKKGIEILEVADGYQMQVRKELIHKVAGLTPHQDLSTGLKKSLAIIVYKEPLKQSELIDLQGSKAYDYVKELEERGLIKAEKFGRTKVLKLTKDFENYFGVEKEKIKEMVRKEMAKHQLSKEGKIPA